MNIIQPFRQNTAVSVLVGPFVGLDGVTPLTSLVIGDLGARLLRPGVAAADLSARTWAHNYAGHYGLSLIAGDFATLGAFRVAMTDPATFCPVWINGWVFDETTFDAFMTEGGLNSIRPTLVVGPVTAGVSPSNPFSSPITLGVFRKEAKTHPLTLIDADGDPVNIPANVKFVVETAVPVPVAQFTVANADIVKTDNVAQAPTTQTHNTLDSETAYQWKFWDVTTHKVLQYGEYKVSPSSE